MSLRHNTFTMPPDHGIARDRYTDNDDTYDRGQNQNFNPPTIKRNQSSLPKIFKFSSTKQLSDRIQRMVKNHGE